MSDRDYEHNRLSYLFLCVIVQAVKDAFFAKDKKKKVLKSGKLKPYAAASGAKTTVQSMNAGKLSTG